MLPENQTNKSPDKPYNKTVPRSMANSGLDLDEACPTIEQSSVPAAMDSYKSSIPEAEATRIITRRK
jgi:hypothetical protein